MLMLEVKVEIGSDGGMTLLSSLPASFKPGRTTMLLALADDEANARPARIRPTASPEMLARRKLALAELREMGGFGDAIADPVAWQREIRQDRPLPGRE